MAVSADEKTGDMARDRVLERHKAGIVVGPARALVRGAVSATLPLPRISPLAVGAEPVV
jgi:hypothetical protein